MFIVTVIFQVAPASVADFSANLIEQARNSLSLEPGCLQFDVSVSDTDPMTFFLYEKYSGKRAFEEHLLSAHFKAFDERVAPSVRSKSVRTWIIAGKTS